MNLNNCDVLPLKLCIHLFIKNIQEYFPKISFQDKLIAEQKMHLFLKNLSPHVRKTLKEWHKDLTNFLENEFKK